MIGIGCLYPIDQDNMITHKNLNFIQANPWRYGSDYPFLSRDLIRCPYHYQDKIDEEDMWDYWSDILALLAAENSFNKIRSFKFRPEGFYDNSLLDDKVKEQLYLGRKLIPRRYVELEPRIEPFDISLIIKL